MRGVRPEEETALREVAERHGQLTTRGPKRAIGRGNAAWVIEAIAAGEIVPVLLSDDILAALPWLAEQRATMDPDSIPARGLDQLIAAFWTASNRRP